jgi:hypothetical protein
MSFTKNLSPQKCFAHKHWMWYSVHGFLPEMHVVITGSMEKCQLCMYNSLTWEVCVTCVIMIARIYMDFWSLLPAQHSHLSSKTACPNEECYVMLAHISCCRVWLSSYWMCMNTIITIQYINHTITVNITLLLTYEHVLFTFTCFGLRDHHRVVYKY